MADPAEGGMIPTTAEAHNAPQVGESKIVAAPPPAATTVITGQKSERELELEAETARLARELKDREATISEQQDKHERYRRSVETPKAPPKKKTNWLSPVIGADDDED